MYVLNSRQVVGNGFCSSVVEHWPSNPEDGGSIPWRKALELCFSRLHGPCLGRLVYIFTTLEFPTHNSDFHIIAIVIYNSSKNTRKKVKAYLFFELQVFMY